MEDKPLIFMQPLSESLEKLHDVIEETAADEHIEMFVANDLTEAQQLITQVGQALVISSAPKRCAQFLQKNRKVIKKIGTKVILLSPKQIPRKTLEKFMKVGLTDLIVEPVAPKTLLYKVKLFLRSISNEDDKGAFETRFSEDGDDKKKKEEEESEVQKAQRLLQVEEENEEITETKEAERQKTEESMVGKKKSSSFQEEEIESYYKGDVKKNEYDYEPEEEERKKREYQGEESTEDGYYKGDVKKGADYNIDDDLVGKNKFQDEENDEYYTNDNKKRTFALEEDEDLYQTENEGPLTEGGFDEVKRKKKLFEAELEEDEIEKRSKNEFENDFDEVKRKKKQFELEVEEEDGDKRYQEEHIETYMKGESKRPEFEVEDEDDEARQKKEDYSVDMDDSKDYEKDNFDEYEEDDEERKKNKLEFDIEDDIDEKDLGEVDHIDKYMRSRDKEDTPQFDLDEDDEKSGNSSNNAYDLDEDEDEEKGNKHKFDLDEDLDDPADNEVDHIDKYMRNRDGNEGHGYEEEDEDFNKKKSLEFDIEDDGNLRREKMLKEGEEKNSNRKKNENDFNVDEDSEYGREKMLKDGEGDELGRKGKGYTEDIHDFERKSVKAKADHIQTHYSNKESISHQQEYDWDGLSGKKKENLDVEKRKLEDISLDYDLSSDHGEQTIDYRQLKDEFESISFERAEQLKKEYGGFSDNSTGKGEITKGVYNLEETEDNYEHFEGQEKEEEEKIPPLYEPIPLGLDRAIEILNLYYKKDVTDVEILNYATKIIKEFSYGTPVYFAYDSKKEDFVEINNGFEIFPNANFPMESWNEYYGEKKEEWESLKLPTWSDENFLKKEIEFFYPYFEGDTLFGYAVVNYFEGFESEKSKIVEIILESLRGIYLENFHEKGVKGSYEKKDSQEKKINKEEKKGFFGKLFKKAN